MGLEKSFDLGIDFTFILKSFNYLFIYDSNFY